MQILKFLVVGVSNTCVSLAVFSGLMRLLPSTPEMAALSQVASYASGMVLSYLLNNFWVFRGKRDAAKALPGFVGSQVGLMLLSAMSIAVATHFFDAPPEMIWMVVMTLITLINFTVLKQWVFKEAQ
ncbi:GtrA family protein [Massilia sp. Mn16-1_5]|uniref:GtrA family protein n=1 Tax=Massilia sp. Mn16-1_5 TaxID=2079199 RepID=UPI0014468BB0|nr:GtrA family protein [Massilia sp. Mn16-1_5]